MKTRSEAYDTEAIPTIAQLYDRISNQYPCISEHASRKCHIKLEVDIHITFHGRGRSVERNSNLLTLDGV